MKMKINVNTLASSTKLYYRMKKQSLDKSTHTQSMSPTQSGSVDNESDNKTVNRAIDASSKVNLILRISEFH